MSANKASHEAEEFKMREISCFQHRTSIKKCTTAAAARAWPQDYKKAILKKSEIFGKL